MKQFAIYEWNMARLEKKLKAISNKCSKYGCTFSYSKVGEEYRELKDDEGRKYTAKFIIVEAEGTAKVNGWEFIASVEHTENGNIISKASEVEVPEKYYTTKAVCEHCNSNRFRKDTFIVMNTESGEFKQVGKSCLKDFTGGLSAEAVAQYISFFDKLIEGEAPDQRFSGERYYDKVEMMQYMAETIRHFGYVRSQEFGSTANTAFEFWCADHGRTYNKEIELDNKMKMAKVGFNYNSKEALQMTTAALEWISKQEEANNYIHNLKTACGLDWVGQGHLGLLASLFPAYDREIEYQARKAEQEKKFAAERASEVNSQHIGKVGDRINFKVHSAKCLTSWETDWGTTFVYKLVDENGNVFTWKTGSCLPDEFDSVKGTVKEHKEFRGIRQTELTRCKVS